MFERIVLTSSLLLVLGSIWFFTGYWMVEKNKSCWVFGIFLGICTIVGAISGMIISAIW